MTKNLVRINQTAERTIADYNHRFNNPLVAHARQLGFTGVELIAVAGIIAILIGLLLPALQTKREIVNRQAAEANALLLASQAKVFHQRIGRAALSLNELVSDCNAQQTCVIPTDLRDGVDDGYLYYFHTKNRVIEAWPGIPGLTGLDTIVVNGGKNLSDQNRRVNVGKLSVNLVNGIGSLATPGADERRQQALDEASAGLFEILGNALAEDPTTAAQIRFDGVGDSDDVLAGFDVDGNGSITAQELMESEGIGYFLKDVIISSFQWGSHGEDLNVFGWSYGASQTSYGLGYSQQRYATTLLVSSDSAVPALIALLDEAERREIAGDIAGADDQRSRYVARLNSGVGSWITRNHAENLRWILTATGI